MCGLSAREHYSGQPPLISVLPIDIMHQVFFECLPSLSLPRFTWPDFPPLVLSHVCRFWRSMSLNCGRLWTDIDLRNTQLALHCLRHAKNATLRIDWSRAWTTKKTIWLHPYAERIQRIKLELDTNDINAFMLSVGRNLPLLDELLLQSNDVAMHGKAHPMYLGMHTPRLRQLSLGNVILTMADLMAFLRETPRMETLGFYVARFAERLEAHPLNLDDRITLPHLRHLKFTRSSDILSILNVLKFPITVHLAMDSTSFNSSTPITPATRSLLHATFPHDELSIEDLSISACPNVEGMDVGVFTFDAFSSHQFVAALTTLGTHLFDWKSVRKVEINRDGSFTSGNGWDAVTAIDDSTWAEFFSQLHALTALSVYKMSLSSVLSALRPIFGGIVSATTSHAPPHNSLSAVTTIPCPHLATLYLFDFDFCATDRTGVSVKEAVSESTSIEFRDAGDMTHVLRLVAEREKAGVPLKVIYLKSHPRKRK